MTKNVITKNEMIMDYVADALFDFILEERENENLTDEQYTFLDEMVFALRNKDFVNY